VWRTLLVAAALGLAFRPLPPSLIERFFSEAWYPTIQPPVTSLSSLVPFALFDALLVAAVVVLIMGVARAGRTLRGWGRLVGNLLVAAAGGYLVFLISWGLNYQRQPIVVRLDWDAGRVTPAAVVVLAERAVQALNRLDGSLGERRREPASASLLQVELAPAFAAAQRTLGSTRLALPGRPKSTLLVPFFRWAGVDGMINPFGLEVLINSEALPVEQPFIVAHEWGHLAGWAREDEASYVGWLTCLRGGADARYSGWLAIYLHVRRELDAARRASLDGQLEAGPRKDLADIAARLARAQPLVQAVSWRTYDRYLRANRVDQGVMSYSEVVRLIVGTAADDDGRPRLRREAATAPRPGPREG
jgi:Protein of unknown function (DUF3810)